MNRSASRSSEIDRLMTGVLRLDAKILGIVLGVLFALAIFVSTNWLVIKGGDRVGPHLRLLGEYFIGYTVTFRGSLVGAAYGFALGALGGGLIGWIYNAVARMRARMRARR